MALRVEATVRQHFQDLLRQLRTARRAAGLSQRSLAPRLNVIIASLADWEAGRDNPTMVHLIRWADALGLRLAIVEPRDSLGRPAVDQPPEDEPWEHQEMRRLAARLRSRRRALDISQDMLASHVGVSRISMQRWESVQVFPRPIAFLVWADSLGCTVTLRRSEGDPIAASPTTASRGLHTDQ